MMNKNCPLHLLASMKLVSFLFSQHAIRENKTILLHVLNGGKEQSDQAFLDIYPESADSTKLSHKVLFDKNLQN